MARIVKEPEIRRNEILDAAQRYITTKGYEQMAIRDLVDALQIAIGVIALGVLPFLPERNLRA